MRHLEYKTYKTRGHSKTGIRNRLKPVNIVSLLMAVLMLTSIFGIGGGTEVLADSAESVNIGVETYSANQYIVSYDSNGGTGTMNSDTILYGNDYITKANEFSRTGYTFVGWNEKRDGTGSNWTSWIGKPWKWTYTKNITLYAQWKAASYTITYVSNGGLGDSFTQTATYDEYFETIKNPFTREGYMFIGFYATDAGTYAKIVPVNSEWQSDSWKTAYIADIINLYNYTNKTWQQYYLLYWKGNYNTVFGCATINFTLRALWREVDYTVTLDYQKSDSVLSGGTVKSIVVPYNYAYGYSGDFPPTPACEGWTFCGWNTKRDGSGDTITKDTIYKLTSDSTLYAQWTYSPVQVKVPQTIISNEKGTSQFRISCDNIVTGNISISMPNTFNYTQPGKSDVTATINNKSGGNIISPSNKTCVYNVTTQNGLSAGCWSGSFNIGLTLTKE